MRTPARIAGHPIHPMMIALPIGLWVFGIVCFAVRMAGGGVEWDTAAMFSVAGGLIGGSAAAAPGFMDLLSLPPGRVRTIAVWHMVTNLVVLTLMAAGYFLRLGSVGDEATTILWAAGLIGLLVSGWLGGSLVYVHGVAVEPQGERQVEPGTEGRKD